ncbi:hypothetical protein ACB092_01G020700 [Castanea dentata]
MYLNPQRIYSNVQECCEHIIHTHIYVDTSETPYQRPKEKVLLLMGSGEEGTLSLQTDLCQLHEKLTKESEILMPFDARSCFVYVLKGSCWALVKSVFILFLGAMMSYHVNHLILGP